MVNVSAGKMSWLSRSKWLWLFVIVLILVSLCVTTWGTNGLNPPPETPPGACPEFDALLGESDKGWEFVFEDGQQVISTDIHGMARRILLDLRRLSATATRFSEVCLSPDGRYMLVSPVADRGLSLVDLASGAIRDVPVPHLLLDKRPADPDGHSLDLWLTHWLHPVAFVVALHHPTPKKMHMSDELFFRFDLNRLNAPHELVLGMSRPVIRIPTDSSVLLFAEADVTIYRCVVWALDTHGIRKATSAEADSFKRLCRGSDSNGPCEVRVEKTPLTLRRRLNLDDKGYDPNRGKYDIYLSGNMVRRTQLPGGSRPVLRWEARLGLYVWQESRDESERTTFLMDSQGHYRAWHTGRYVGAIRRLLQK
jgi:hypothetical protein